MLGSPSDTCMGHDKPKHSISNVRYIFMYNNTSKDLSACDCEVIPRPDIHKYVLMPEPPKPEQIHQTDVQCKRGFHKASYALFLVILDQKHGCKHAICTSFQDLPWSSPIVWRVEL